MMMMILIEDGDNDARKSYCPEDYFIFCFNFDGEQINGEKCVLIQALQV